ncbi:MAG: hypothetical protein IBX72_11675 [Nitrospirae bacterium]|nr:hypothetical protein [Nitrospirota bacterium]
MPELNLTGIFYPSFTSNTAFYSEADKSCIQYTVERLLTVETSAIKPGMLLGKIQSGKTKTFLAIMALAFDNGFDISVILTKGTKALTRQTLERVRREFAYFYEQDLLQIYDIMTVPSGLTGYELSQKLIFIAKKQIDNMDKLSALFRETYPQLTSKRVLIIDDEADYASIGFRRTREEGIRVNTTTRQIDELRRTLASSAFLQVTATPYSLYLQPDDIVIQGVEFRPVRPAFTELVPVHRDYIGSDYYFERSTEEESVASFIYHSVSQDELNILHHEDRRRFKIEECLTSTAIQALRSAICNFIVGGCIRRLQDEHAAKALKKFSFLVHTETARASHSWQERIVATLADKLSDAVRGDNTLLQQLLTTAYEEIAASIGVMDHYLPPLGEVLRECLNALEHGWLMITKVNSERQVEALLDIEGQLRLRTPLNIFIGGQILDRGVTIANLIGFFYGRRPQVYQQDTVLQHSRMFGFRPIEDLTVTRFYTEPAIYDAMRRMHESDVALREEIEINPNGPIVFIQRDESGHVIPCSPNKILVSRTTTLRPFKRILPVGFQSDYAIRVAPVVHEIDSLLEDACMGNDFEEPFEIPFAMAADILRRIETTLIMAREEGYEFDWEAARAALRFMSESAIDPTKRGKVWCLVRTDRNLSQKKASIGSHRIYSDSPDTTRTESAVAQRVAIDVPMLMLIRQNGRDDLGWRGTPFYWPVIVAQQNLHTSIFAHETMA